MEHKTPWEGAGKGPDPFPPQHQDRLPGLEYIMEPRPQAEGSRLLPEAGGQGRPDHRGRQRDRPGGGL